MLVLHLNGLSQSGTIVTYRHRGKLTDRLTNHIVNEGSLVCYRVLHCITLYCVLQYCAALLFFLLKISPTFSTFLIHEIPFMYP